MSRNSAANPVRHNSASPGIAGRFFGVIFGLFFAGGGFFFLWGAAIQPAIDGSRADDWVQTPATIIESQVMGSGDSLKNDIRFRYDYGGVSYESDQSHLTPPKLSYAEVQRLRDQLPVGEKTTAFVNPELPREAVLFRNHSGSVLIGLFALPFILIGLAVAGFSIFGKSKKEKRQGFSRPLRKGFEGHRKLSRSLFGLPFLGIGLTFCWIAGISPLIESREAQNWPEVPCTITKSFVDSHSDSDGTTYSIEIRFTYEWEGRTFHGENYTFGNVSSSGKASKQEVVRKYPEGSRATCFVNPEDPYEAVITTEVGLMPYGIIAFSSIFIAVGAGLIISGLRRKKNTAVGAQLADDEPIGETLELSPVTNRITRTLLSLFFAIGWNGISSIPIIAFLNEESREWMLLIVGLVFGGIGIFLIINAIRSILILRNPLPRVLIAPGRVQPGTDMLLSWQIKGATSRLSNLSVYLEGVETARYLRGTKTVTDENVFFQKNLFETRNKGAFREGSAEYPFPEETVPSLKVDHNEIHWQIVFIGEIARWPDLGETYRLPVHPVKP